MSTIYKVLSGIGILIAIYLFISNGHTTISTINSLSNALATNVQVLQGRKELITK